MDFMRERIDIMLVDNDPSCRALAAHALQQMSPRINIVAEAGSLGEACGVVDTLHTLGLVLLHLKQRDADESQLFEHLRNNRPEVKMLVFSGDVDPRQVMLSVVEAINAIVAGAGHVGKIIMSPSYDCTCGVERNADTAEADIRKLLSPREMEVMELCAKGMSAQDIADKLFLSRRTVEGHKMHIFEKMGFRSLGELISYAFGKGLFVGGANLFKMINMCVNKIYAQLPANFVLHHLQTLAPR